jgi:hypothetical protein
MYIFPISSVDSFTASAAVHVVPFEFWEEYQMNIQKMKPIYSEYKL